MSSKAEPNIQLPTPEEYNRFVEGLGLRRVRLIEAHIRALEPMPDPTASEVELEESYTFNPVDGGFEAVGSFRLRIANRETQAEQGVVEVSFGFLYESERNPAAGGFEGYFQVFKEVNLPINMWPFVREFVHNAMSRMDWPPFTLPLRKVGPAPARARSRSRSKARTP